MREHVARVGLLCIHVIVLRHGPASIGKALPEAAYWARAMHILFQCLLYHNNCLSSIKKFLKSQESPIFIAALCCETWVSAIGESVLSVGAAGRLQRQGERHKCHGPSAQVRQGELVT